MPCIDFTCNSVETCPKCWSAAYAPAVAKSLGRPLRDGPRPPRPKHPGQRPKRPDPFKLPCVHRGEAAGETRSCSACTGYREVSLLHCTKHGRCYMGPYHPKKEAGLQCCGHCPDRQAPEAEHPLSSITGQAVTVPPPPPLHLLPTRPWAVVNVVVGPEATALHEVTGPYHRGYADRVGADHVVLRWPGHPRWPMSAKFAIGRVLEHYERIAYLDVDTLPRPGAVNLFELCGPAEFGACDELPWHRANPRFRREQYYRTLLSSMGLACPEHLPWYLNMGVFVAGRDHLSILQPPARPIPIGHCSEQDYFNGRVLEEYRAGRLRLRLLDRRANWQNWTDWGLQAATPDAILHWSGGGQERRSRVDRIAEVTARSPLRRPWAICSTERTGSTLLACVLEDAGLGSCGPGGYEALHARADTAGALAEIRAAGAVKVHWYQMRWHRLTESLLFLDGRHVHLTRRDVVRQAVSLVRALQTQQWHSHYESRGEPVYDRDAIARCREQILRDQAAWEEYFLRHGLQPVRVAYEDLEADYAGTVRRLLDQVGEPGPVPPPRLAKQADELSEEWVRQFRSEQAADGSRPK